jgi:hypothetical protein
MPGLDDSGFIVNDYSPYHIELARSKAVVPRKRDGIQPKFCVLFISTNMNVIGSLQSKL